MLSPATYDVRVIIIALACLVAHGDVSGAQSAAMRKHYEADWIMDALERLHPEFYPEP